MTLDDIGLYSANDDTPSGCAPMHVQARCVCALIRRYLPKLKNVEAYKINVYVSDQQVPVEDPRVKNGFASVRIQRSLSDFYAVDAQEKRLFAYEALLEGAVKVSDTLSWPTDEVKDAFSKAKDIGLENRWIFQSKWNNPRSYRAFLECCHDIGHFRAHLLVKQKDGEIVKRVLLFEERPDEFCFHPYLGTLKWIGPSTVCLLDRSGETVADPVQISEL